MPYKMRKVDGYQVKGPSRVHAKHTTKVKAEAQMRLLRGVEHGMVPRKQDVLKRKGVALKNYASKRRKRR